MSRKTTTRSARTSRTSKTSPAATVELTAKPVAPVPVVAPKAPAPVEAAPTPSQAAVATSATTLPVTVSHEKIALRAYELFLARGGAHGHAAEDWLQAERELRQARA